MSQLPKCKHAQITIFVIIALILVLSIVLIFVFLEKPFMPIRAEEDPQGFIEQCVSLSLEQAADKIVIHGGYINPETSPVGYLTNPNNAKKVVYLCYTAENNELCLNKEPMLAARIKQEIYNDISDDIEDCFDTLEASFSGYSYYAEPTNLSIEIKPKKVIAKINKKITITKQEETQTLEIFNTAVNSPMWDFVIITNEIINQEVSCKPDCSEACYADIVQIMRDNHDFEIRMPYNEEKGKIYTIKEIASEKEFAFAIRNCVRLIW